jgi:hypothetical protein
MKPIIKALKTQHEALRAVVRKREEIFTSRTEKWQWSQKGEDYDDTTMLIERQAEELKAVFENLEDLN